MSAAVLPLRAALLSLALLGLHLAPRRGGLVLAISQSGSWPVVVDIAGSTGEASQGSRGGGQLLVRRSDDKGSFFKPHIDSFGQVLGEPSPPLADAAATVPSSATAPDRHGQVSRQEEEEAEAAAPRTATAVAPSLGSPSASFLERNAPPGAPTHCGSLWDRVAAAGGDGNNSCEMQEMWTGINITEAQMCIRSYKDLVSDYIRKDGSWPDCPPLLDWWFALPDRSLDAKFDELDMCLPPGVVLPDLVPSKLYVDIGANIGACLVQMLSQPDVLLAVAFEHNPSNLYYLTNSVLAGYPLKDKLNLFALALGEKEGTHPVYGQPGFPGNSALDSPTFIHTVPLGHVGMSTLDTVFLANSTRAPPYIHLMKLDGQGHEVKILNGAKKLLKAGAINAVKFMLATVALQGQKTGPAELLNVFLRNDFVIFKDTLLDVDGGRTPPVPLTDQDLREYACGTPVYLGLVAVHLGIGEGSFVQQQSLIDCNQRL